MSLNIKRIFMCSCLSCPAGRLLLGGKCLKSAPPPRGYYESANGLWFLPCHAACLDCFGGGHQQCSSCPRGRKLVGDACVGCKSKVRDAKEWQNLISYILVLMQINEPKI